jgi:F-type H+-transporting ATPase subunit epsilon
MRTFVLHLQDATRYERLEGVSSFVGEDASGSFGLRAGHARYMTSLIFGLARFRLGEGTWQFLAVPGALLYFINNELTINTRRYLRDADYERISTALTEQLLAEEEHLRGMKEQLRHMEQEMLRRLWQMRRPGEVAL